jgi:hypothetical protein
MTTASHNRTNPKSTATISINEFMRIKNTILTTGQEQDERKNIDARLKQISQIKAKQWPDSIEMAKKTRLESRQKIFFEKELEKRKIDDEEKKFQEMQKKIIVEKANKLLFEQQDAVKSFNSKLLYSDVLKERDIQKEIQDRKKDTERHIENKWYELEQEKMKEFDMKGILKQEEEKEKKKEQINAINGQFHEFKIRKVKEYQDRVVEGEIIKIAAKRALEEEKRKEEERRTKAKHQQDEFKRANENLKIQKDIKKQQEKEEEKRIEEFAVKKQQMIDLRKRKEIENFQNKQGERQKLIDRQIEHLKQIKNKEEEILAKQVKEAEEKRNKELEEKEKRRNEMQRRIDETREYQIRRKREIKEQEREEDKEFVEIWKEKMKQLVILLLFNFKGRRRERRKK